ncbi:MAG: imidazole glycerol phosphate synthase subunit HisH [Candidatus Omnitrophica bacterium]|nr:imidazole glycerol phosphate synthase subunit HisH [Candidatus Omnitrophota bacterium]
MIAIIDYGLGNLRSVAKALESAGAKVKVTSSPEEIIAAKAVVLPGVGAFYAGMENLRNLNLIPAIQESVKQKKPFLGICLGLQLLFGESEEHGFNKGLGLIEGKVKKFTGKVKIPHMGWNQVQSKAKIFDGVTDNSYFYFVHSYYVEPKDKNIIIGKTNYSIEFASTVSQDNIFGVQFHPEKSSQAGIKVLRNFISLC